MGRVDSVVRDAVFAKSNVMLHTAGTVNGRTEGAPVALVEAMEAGLAIVACDAGGVASVVGPAGRIVHGDAEEQEIANAILEMCSERVRAKFGEAGVARARNWRWDTTVEALACAVAR
jgi:glycosyltransferase involved in cell wall biosynthesis